ncbi:hypothetical protein V6N13_024869 [Hibiscus sabdariffa]
MGMIAPSGDAGGQLSDDMEAMGTPVSLERLRAPLAVEDQREAIFFARHALQELGGDPVADSTDMEADDIEINAGDGIQIPGIMGADILH